MSQPSVRAAPFPVDPIAVFNCLRQATPLIVLDHGRAGNAFFMRLFDQHPEVLAIPQVGYFPFHVTRILTQRITMPGAEVFDFLMNKTDFRYVVNDVTEDIARKYAREGDNPDVAMDRPLVRDTLRKLCADSYFKKRDVIAAMHTAYAIGAGRDVSKVKYLLMNDSPLHYWSHLHVSIMEAYASDLPDCVLVHLVRDPRATFASLRHQMVKQYNGVYQFSLKGFFAALKSVAFGNAGWCVFAHILSYTSLGSKELSEWRKGNPARIYLLRNEDLNLHFLETMQWLTKVLGIEWSEAWSNPDYVPTSGGRPWKGTGAYNNTYQTLTRKKVRSLAGLNGDQQTESYRFNLGSFLANDPEEVSRSSAGPNRHVTERWKSRLTRHEIAFLEAVYLEEMLEIGYQPMFVRSSGFSRLRGLMECFYPVSGELFSHSWMASQTKAGLMPFLRLMIELGVFPILFLCSRLALLRLYFTGKLKTR